MPLFEYQAKTIQGLEVKGKLEAVDEAAVITSLRQKNYYPVKVRPFREGLDIDLSKYKKIPIKDIAVFCRQFAFIINSGMPILKALEIVKEQSENNKLKQILVDVFNDVQKGKDFSEAMRKHKDIPIMLVNMIEVGEVSGTLDRIMERMAEYYDKEYKFNKKVSQAMTYPAVISIFALLVVILLVVKVLPTFTGMLEGLGSSELPLPTKIILSLSDILRTKGIVILFFITVLVIIFKMWANRPKGRDIVDRFKINVPVFGKINKKIVTAKFARTFGTLMASGVSLLQSLEICSQVVGNKIIGDMLQNAKEDIKKGFSLGDTLEDKGAFPVMLTQMIKIGEESGTLDEILVKTAEFYDNEVDTVTAQLATLIEPIIIIVLAVVVGFIVLSIILPIFQIYNAM